MLIGLLQLELRIAGSHSLKDKRQVIQSLIEQVRRRFNVSVAEVGHQDAWQAAILGIACVSNERRFLDEAMSKAERFFESDPRIEIVNSQVEII
jgi:uncharacterized protein YlxP (DUF503 family)